MKKISRFTKVYLCFVAIALLVLLFIFCGPTIMNVFMKQNIENQKNDKSTINISKLGSTDVVEEHIHILNKNCPLDVNNGAAKITGVYLNDNKVTYHVKVLSDINPQIFKSQMKSNVDNLLLYLYVIFNGQNDEYLQAHINRGIMLVFKMQFPTGVNSEFCVKSDEIKKVRDFARNNPKEALHKYIQNQLSLYNSYLPNEIDDGVIFEKICQEGKYIIYQLKVDNETFLFINSNSNQVKSELFADLKETSLAILESCKVAKLGVKYLIKNNITKKTISFDYPYEYLINDPFIKELNMSKISLI